MKKVSVLSVVAMLALTVCLTAANASTVVLNGSFEDDPEVLGNQNGSAFGADWDIWSSLPGWTDTSDGNGIEVQTAGTVGLTPNEGKAYVELDTTANSGIKQTVTLDAGSYEMSFWFSPRVDSLATNLINYGVGELLTGSVNGPLGPYQVGEWTEVKSWFDVTDSGDYDLYFAADGTSDGYGGFVDNVSIAAVPIPAGGLLLVGGLGFLSFLRRRSRRTTSFA